MKFLRHYQFDCGIKSFLPKYFALYTKLIKLKMLAKQIFQMAQMNYRLNQVETCFISTNPLYSYLSSSLVKDVATHGGDVGGLVPEAVLKRLHGKLSSTM